MSGVRVLVGTRKGAFILTSDGKREKWEVSGPHFAGWDIYHVTGSVADPVMPIPRSSSHRAPSKFQRAREGVRAATIETFDGAAHTRKSVSASRTAKPWLRCPIQSSR